MASDRSRQRARGHLPLTHEFLAMMLGVNRAGVSIAAQILKRAGMIDYARGRVTITNRSALEETACECYATIQDELRVLFPVRNGGIAPPAPEMTCLGRAAD